MSKWFMALFACVVFFFAVSYAEATNVRRIVVRRNVDHVVLVRSGFHRNVIAVVPSHRFNSNFFCQGFACNNFFAYPVAPAYGVVRPIIARQIIYRAPVCESFVNPHISNFAY